MARLSLEHDSDTMLDEHDSPQWYNIVDFEHKLSWLCGIRASNSIGM